MTDLQLLARVFIDYRRAYTIEAPACQEIIAQLAEAGIDALNMSDEAILAAVTPPSHAASWNEETERGIERQLRGRGVISPAKRAKVASGDEIKPADPQSSEDTQEGN
jgi:hypothetical protein